MGMEATTMRTRRPATVGREAALLAFLAIGGFTGGLSFVIDPTGARLGAKLAWLEKTPVRDFLLPGLFLLVVYAIGSVTLIVGLVWRPAPGVLRPIDATLHHHWAWVGTIAMGVTLVAWIVDPLRVHDLHGADGVAAHPAGRWRRDGCDLRRAIAAPVLRDPARSTEVTNDDDNPAQADDHRAGRRGIAHRDDADVHRHHRCDDRIDRRARGARSLHRRHRVGDGRPPRR